jgi:N-acetylmuramoyl-L-alanine amidase
MSMKNRQADRSLAFGQMLGAAMHERGFVFARHHAEPVPGENRPIIDEARGVYQYDDLIVLKHAPMPAALLECGVIINRAEEVELEKPETQARIVEAAASAVEMFFAGPVTGK